MKTKFPTRLFVLSTIVCVLTLGVGLGSVLTPNQAEAKRRRTKTKYRKGGYLFAASSAFPTSGESIKDFIKAGRKHSRRNRVRMLDGSVSMQVLLVLKRRYRTSEVNFVLYKRGKRNHIGSQTVPVRNRKLQLFVTPLQFSGVKSGRYELRATVVRKYGRTFHVTVLARYRFRIL